MNTEKSDQWEMVIRAGKKGELELEKMFCLLLDLQGMLRQEQKEHPELYRIMDLERLDTVITDARNEIIRIKDLLDRLNGCLRRLKQGSGPGGNTEEKPYAPRSYYQAVAEQEKDLYRLWPAKYGMFDAEN